MSEASYWLNVQRGVTGRQSSTCLLAAFDRFSPVTGIRTETYQRHEQLTGFYADQTQWGPNYASLDFVREYDAHKAEVRRQLGVHTTKNVTKARVNDENELRIGLAKLAQGRFRTAVYLDLDGLHAVGVQSLGEDYYDVRSTWSPFPHGEPVSVSQIFRCLDRAPRTRTRATNGRNTIQVQNIVALPAERAGSRPPYPHL